jgi:hypothetical protein
MHAVNNEDFVRSRDRLVACFDISENNQHFNDKSISLANLADMS